MSRLSFDDLSELRHIPLQEWLESRGMHQETYDYIKVLTASQTGQAEPRMTDATDFLGYMAMVRDIKMNLVNGSVATVNKLGTIAIPLALEQPIVDGGGHIWRDTPVREVIIEDGVARGVRYLKDGKEHTLLPDRVVCTMPPKYAFPVQPKEHFPHDWVEFLEQEHWGMGLLTGWVSTARSLIPDLDIDKRSFIYMPAITSENKGFIGVVDIVMYEFAS